MEYSLALSLVDYIPNLAFLADAIFLVKTVVCVRGRACSRMTMLGALLIFGGGVIKATWKLLVTLGVGNYTLMSDMQFALLAPGFFALLVTTILMARKERSDLLRKGGVVLAMAPWKIPLLAIMTISSLGTQGILAYLAFKRGLRPAGALFTVAVVCMLAMTAMSAGEQSVAKQWVEETVNSIGQITFAVGSWMIYRSVSGNAYKA